MGQPRPKPATFGAPPIDALDLHGDRRHAGVPTLSVLTGPLAVSIGRAREWARQHEMPIIAARLDGTADIATEWISGLSRHPMLRERAIATVAAATEVSLDVVSSLVDSHARDAWMLFEHAAAVGAKEALACTVLGHPTRPATDPMRSLAELLDDCEGRPVLLGIVDVASQRATDQLQNLIQLVEQAPRSIAIAAIEREAFTTLSGGSDTRWKAILREGRIDVNPAPVTVPSTPMTPDAQRARDALASQGVHDGLLRAFDAAATADGAAPSQQGKARSLCEALLFESLESRAETAGYFELNGTLGFKFGNRPVEVDLLCRRLGIAVEVDGYHHFAGGKDAWRRDRRKDVLLQQHEYLVVRCLAHDIVHGIDDVLHAIEDAVRQRKRKFLERAK